METVREVLNHLGADNKSALTVYNKMDVFQVKSEESNSEMHSEKGSVEVSARTGAGIETLKGMVVKLLSEARVKISVVLPPDSGALVSRVYECGQVTGCRYEEDGIHLTAVVTEGDAARLRASAIR
jgi:GTP-binding protein HflX